MLTQMGLMPPITVHMCICGQRMQSVQVVKGSGWVFWVWSEPDLSVSSRIVGTEAIMVKGVVVGGRIASDLVFIA